MRFLLTPILLAAFLTLSLATLRLSAQTTITYADGETNAIAYDTTGNDHTLTVASGSATQSGIISGTGAITKTGDGTLTLSGVNTYSGGTTVSAGTLLLNPTGSIAGNVSNAGTFTFARSDDYTFNGVISGTGGVVHDGYIVRLTAAQTYTGATAVKSGAYLVLPTTVDQGLAAATTVDLEAGSNLDISNRALTLAGLTGAGTVYSFNASAGHLTLNIASGTQTFSGVLGGGSYPHFALTKTGAGTQILSGANTYTGATTISAGTLQIGDGGSTGTLGTGAVVNNAALVFNRTGALTYAGDISGSGSLTLSGSGTITLSGNNSYTGTTTINAGTLSLLSTAAFYGGTIDATNAAKISIASGGVLGLGVGGTSSFSVSDISTIATNATLAAGAKLALDTTNATGGAATLNDFALGSVNLQKIGTGTLTLTGTTTGTSTLDVVAGTLRFGGTAAFYGGTIDATTAARISVSADATLALDFGGASSFSAADFATIRQNASFASGAGLGLDTTNATGGAATFNNLDAGSARFTKIGPGSLTLTGTTSSTGPTTVSGGSLIIGSDALLGTAPGTATAGHLTLNGGTLDTTATFTLDANRGVALGTSGGTLATANATTLTVAGDISGSGNLTKTGNGTLILAAGSGATGSITVSAGTLNLGNGGTAALGATGITNNGTIVFNSSSDLTMSGTLSGTGGFTKSGTGKLTIGNLSSTGGFTVSAGELVNNTSIGDQAAIVSGSTATFTQTTASKTVGASGTGSLSVTNGGTYALTSTSIINYLTMGSSSGSNGTVTVNGTGSTIASNGRLRVASSGTGTLNLEAGGTATFNHTSDSYVGNTSTGAGTANLTGTNTALTTVGRLVVGNSGTGTVNIGSGATLTANRILLASAAGSSGTLNLNAGGTLVVSDATDTALSSGSGTATFNFAGGTLKSNGSNSLTVSSNATLGGGTTSTVDTNGQAGTFSGILSGSGALTKAGAGTLTLSGANTYTGATTVSAGTLAVNGSLAATALSVADGATLGGAGSIAGLATFASGAHLAPGNSPGTITFSSGLTLASGSILDFQLGTTSDKIAVTGGTLTGPAGTGGITLNLSDAGGFAPATYLLFDFSGANLSDFSAADFSLGTTITGYDYAFNLTGSTLELIATTSAIPEPSAYAAFAGVLALLAAWHKRRRT